MSLSEGERMHLRNLCRIFEIRTEATENNPPGGFVVLQNLYSMPTIDNRAERRLYGNGILRAAGSAFPRSSGQFTSEFHGVVARHVAMIQEFPHYYADLNESPERLAEKYESYKAVAFWLALLGVGAGTGAVGPAVVDGAAEGIQRRSVRAAIEMAARRFAGQGGLPQALGSRFAVMSGPIGVALIAGGTIAYFHAIERMEEISTIMLHRYQNGEVSDEIYRRISPEIDPSNIVKYWER